MHIHFANNFKVRLSNKNIVFNSHTFLKWFLVILHWKLFNPSFLEQQQRQRQQPTALNRNALVMLYMCVTKETHTHTHTFTLHTQSIRVSSEIIHILFTDDMQALECFSNPKHNSILSPPARPLVRFHSVYPNTCILYSHLSPFFSSCFCKAMHCFHYTFYCLTTPMQSHTT